MVMTRGGGNEIKKNLTYFLGGKLRSTLLFGERCAKKRFFRTLRNVFFGLYFVVCHGQKWGDRRGFTIVC